MKKLALALLILLLGAAPAAAQSACQFIAYGVVLTAGEWQSCFQAKQDAAAAAALNQNNIFTGVNTIQVVTQVAYDSSANAASDLFVQAAIRASMSTVPLSGVTGGTYSFASVGSMLSSSVTVTATSGAITGVTLVINGGSGVAVGDMFTVVSGNYDAVVRATAVSGGAITAVQVLYGGSGYVAGTYALSTTPYAKPFTYTLAGALTSNATFIMQNGARLLNSDQWIFANNTTGAFTTKVQLSNGSDAPTGTGVVIPQGTNNSASVLVQTDGVTDVWPVVTTQVPGTVTNDAAPQGNLGEYVQSSCTSPTNTATVTITIASPGVVTWTGHGFQYSTDRTRQDACPVVLTTTGALPTGLTAGTTYYVVPSSITANTFTLATSVANALAGTAINTSGSQSGTQTGTAGAPLTTATAKDVTGVPLTAGDWECRASLVRRPGATTSFTQMKSSLVTAPATDGSLPLGTMDQFSTAANVPGANDTGRVVMPARFSLAANSNVYLDGDDTFTVSTDIAYGTLACRRIR